MSPRAISSQASSVCGSPWRKSRSTSLARWASKPQTSTHSASEDLPRPQPFTQADVEAPSRLTGLPKEARRDGQPDVLPPTEVVFTEVITDADGRKRVRKERRGLRGITDEMRHFAKDWNFSEAINTLGL